MPFDDEFDRMWSEGLAQLAPEVAAGEHERVMRRVARLQRRRVTLSSGLTAIAVVIALVASGGVDGHDTVTTEPGTTVALPLSTTTVDPASSTTIADAPNPPSNGNASRVGEPGDPGDAGDGGAVPPAGNDGGAGTGAGAGGGASEGAHPEQGTPESLTTSTVAPEVPPVTTTSVPWTYNPDGYALGGTIDIWLQNGALTVTPGDVPFGLWRFRFRYPDDTLSTRVRVYVTRPNGMEKLVLERGEYTHETGVFCTGTWTLRAVDVNSGKEIAVAHFNQTAENWQHCI